MASAAIVILGSFLPWLVVLQTSLAGTDTRDGLFTVGVGFAMILGTATVANARNVHLKWTPSYRASSFPAWTLWVVWAFGALVTGARVVDLRGDIEAVRLGYIGIGLWLVGAAFVTAFWGLFLLLGPTKNPGVGEQHHGSATN